MDGAGRESGDFGHGTSGAGVYHACMRDLPAADGVKVVEMGAVRAAFAGAATGRPGEDPAEAAAAWWAASLGAPVPVLVPEQRHTSILYAYGREGPLAPGPVAVGVCDGVITDEPGVALMVRTADCLPVVLAGGGAVAVVHAGWRGLAADILGRAVSRLEGEYGVAPAALEAVVGTGVGPCHYRVGDDVRAALGRVPVSAAAWRRGEAVDLSAWAAGRLRRLGLDAASVRTLGGCTWCSGGFHSHRRDGDAAGRQWTAAILLPASG